MIDKTLGHYQITNQFGKSGMCEVCQVKDHPHPIEPCQGTRFFHELPKDQQLGDLY
jgi:hypothetical protein